MVSFIVPGRKGRSSDDCFCAMPGCSETGQRRGNLLPECRRHLLPMKEGKKPSRS